MLLEIDDVGKTYRGGKQAVAQVNLDIRPGVLGLLGPNGAGKSSLMRILATVTRPSRGRVLWNGTDIATAPNRLRDVLGYLPQDFGVYPQLNAREFLSYLAAVKGMPSRLANQRIDELLELFDLTGAGRRPLGKYSGGMLRRVGIAQALLADPQLLIVDEPTAGLDPEERVVFRNLLSDLAADRIVLLSTHIVSDIESVASQVAVMVDGALRISGTPQVLLGRAQGTVWEATLPAHALAAIRDRYVISRIIRAGDDVRVRMLSPIPPIPEAVPVVPDLEDAYLTVIDGRRR